MAYCRPMQANTIRLDPNTVGRVLGITGLAILLASVTGQAAALVVDDDLVREAADFLYVDNERNLPTGFAVLLLLFASLLLAVIATLERQSGGRWARHWAALAVGFGLMAVDEAWSFHEKLIGPGRELLGGAGELGIFFYAWVLFGIALILLLAPFFMRFVISLPAVTRNRFLLAACLFVGGAIGTELVAGNFNELHGLHEKRGDYGIRHFQYSLLATAEEGLEFAGSIVFIRALLLQIAGTWGEVRFSLAGVPRPGRG